MGKELAKINLYTLSSSLLLSSSLSHCASKMDSRYVIENQIDDGAPEKKKTNQTENEGADV